MPDACERTHEITLDNKSRLDKIEPIVHSLRQEMRDTIDMVHRLEENDKEIMRTLSMGATRDDIESLRIDIRENNGKVFELMGKALDATPPKASVNWGHVWLAIAAIVAICSLILSIAHATT